MIRKTHFILAAALFAVIPFFAHDAIAQGAATASAGMNYQDICVTDPNAKLTPSVKPRKKVVNMARTSPVQARAKRLVAARKKKPVDNTPVPLICKRVSFVAPEPVMSLCQTAISASANVTASQASAMLMNAGLNDNRYLQNGLLNTAQVQDKQRLAQAVSSAIRANPEAAPAITAYAIRGLNPQDVDALQAVAKAAYEAAPGQAAGLTYASVAANPNQGAPIVQAMLAVANDADDGAIRQCAVDVPEIQTAAFVPALAGPTSISQDDIRNTIRDISGPGPDGSGA